MTGSNSVTDIPTPSRLRSRNTSIQSLEDAFSNKHTGTHSSQSQHRNTARGKRFSQKLIDAANRTSFARNPLLTPSASSSLSPPLGNYLDDDGLTDSSSCISTPQRNEYERNRNFGNLMLSPLHMDLANHTTSLSPPYTHEISSNNNAARVIGIQTRQDGKRPETRQHVADAPSLSVKPKRRKLKQQKKTSWRTGNDAKLDTAKVHEEVSENAQQNDNQQQLAEDTHNESTHNHHQQYRRSERIAKKHEGMELSGSMVTKRSKKIPLILGTPGGSSQRRDAEIYTDDDIDDDGTRRNTSSNSSNNDNNNINNNNSNQRRRQQCDRLDVVEFRLSQLLYTYDTLDLSHYSIVPRTTTPLVIIISDDDDDNDGNNNNNRSSSNRNRNRNRKKCHNSTIRSSAPGDCVDLTSSSPPSSPSLPTTTTLRDSEPSTTTNAMSTNASHTLVNTQNDDDLSTDKTLPSSDSNEMNLVLANTSSISPTSETNTVNLPTAGDNNTTTVTNDGTYESTSPTPSSTSDALTTVVETPSSKRHNHDAFISSQKPSAPVETTNEKTIDHTPSEQAKHMYAFLVKGGTLERENNTNGQQQQDDLSRLVTTDDHDQRNKENLAPSTTTTTITTSLAPRSSSSSSDTQQCQVSLMATHLHERSSSSTSTTTTTTDALDESSMLKSSA